MFTGLIEEVGTISAIHKTGSAMQIHIHAARVMSDLRVGDSLAVNGVCLTVTHVLSTGVSVDVVPETVRRSTFGAITVGKPVNLERAMPANGRFGGHMVAGHVDVVGTITQIGQEDIAKILTVHTSKPYMRYIMEKGSITIDGVSLTVMDIKEEVFRVSIIPHTAVMTTLQNAAAGQKVNLEVDMVAKYIERLLGFHNAGDFSEPKQDSLWTFTRLRELGY